MRVVLWSLGRCCASILKAQLSIVTALSNNPVIDLQTNMKEHASFLGLYEAKT